MINWYGLLLTDFESALFPIVCNFKRNSLRNFRENNNMMPNDIYCPILAYYQIYWYVWSILQKLVSWEIFGEIYQHTSEWTPGEMSKQICKRVFEGILRGLLKKFLLKKLRKKNPRKNVCRNLCLNYFCILWILHESLEIFMKKLLNNFLMEFQK